MHLDVVDEESDGNCLDKPVRGLAYQASSSSSSDDGSQVDNRNTYKETIEPRSMKSGSVDTMLKLRSNSAT